MDIRTIRLSKHSLHTFYSGKDNYKMIHNPTILYLLTLSASILGKTIQIADEEDYPRYAYNYGLDSLYARDSKSQWDVRNGNQVNGPYALLDPLENSGVVEYTADDFGALNAIVQKLAANLTPLPLFGPLPLPLPPVNPLINPLNYGFGASAPLGLPKVTVTGSSIPWDPKTRSYGGWVPLRGPARKVSLATLVTRKYVNGQLYKVRSKPISLTGKTIIIKRRYKSDE